MRARLLLAAALLAAVAGPAGAATGPQVEDACGDADDRVVVHGQRQSLVPAPPERDLRRGGVALRHDATGPVAVVGTVEVCGTASADLEHRVQWTHGDGCWTTLALEPRRVDQGRLAPEVRLEEWCPPDGDLEVAAELVSSVVLPGSAAVLDGARVVLEVPLSAVPAASAGRYADGTTWSSTYAAVGRPENLGAVYGSDVTVVTGYDGGFGGGYVVGEDAPRG